MKRKITETVSFSSVTKKKDSIKFLEVLDTSVRLYKKCLIEGKFPYPELEKESVIIPDILKIIISDFDFIQALENARSNLNENILSEENHLNFIKKALPICHLF